MKILIVSGFLGAGKTTFIAEMSHRCKNRFVVMENEIGSVGVDGGILNSTGSDGMKIWELTEGCICCSMKTDFATSVLTIESALAPEFLVVEPTGVGMLSRIISNIKEIEYERISILSPITIIDAQKIMETERDFTDIYKDQLGAAGTVILSKTELLSADERAAIARHVRETAKGADIVDHPYSENDPGWWESIWRKELSGETIPSTKDADADLESVGFSETKTPDPAALATMMENAIRGRYGRIVRSKGLVSTGRELIRFDLVEGTYSITGPIEGEGPKAVFIGKDLDTDALRKELLAVYVEPEHEHEHHHKHRHDHEHS